MGLFEYIIKAKSGVYKDNPENRRLHRAGLQYGQKKQQESVPDVNKENFELAEAKVEKMLAVKQNFDDVSQAVCMEVGCIVSPTNIKKPIRIAQKMASDNSTIDDIKDVMRNTFVVNSDADVGKVIEVISKHYKVVRVKRQMPDKFAGYSGNIVNVELPNGEIGEMQVNTPQMIFGKEVERDARMILGDSLWERLKANAGNLIPGLGHRMYEVFRDDSIDVERLDIVERNSRIYYDRIRKISL